MTAKAEIILVDGDEARSPKTITRLVAIWNHHFGGSLEASTRLFAWTLAPRAERNVALFASMGRLILAYAIVSHVQGAETGTIDALLLPARGIAGSGIANSTDTSTGKLRTGKNLLHAAEDWLREQGATAVQIGGPWSVLRGNLMYEGSGALLDGEETYPVYQERVQDMSLDVSRYVPPTDIEAVGGVVHPAQPRDRDDVAEFLNDPQHIRIGATSNHATVEDVAHVRTLIAAGERVSDLMLLWTANGLEGICQIIFADSTTPLELAYPYMLMRPWAALGVVAVRDSLPNGAVELLLDAAIRRLHNNGINSCVAIGIVASRSYERMGFENYGDWNMVAKNL